MEFYCAKCGRRESVATRKSHCDCGGLWKLDYTPPRFDLAEIDRDEWSMFRRSIPGVKHPNKIAKPRRKQSIRRGFGTPDAIRTHDLQSRSYQAHLQNAGFMRLSGHTRRYPEPFRNAAIP